MYIVQPIKESKALLTLETKNERGVISGVLCDKDGNPLGNDRLGEAREVYLDSISGNRFMRVSPAEAEQLRKDGTEVCQGQGEVHGWFVEAPDYTVNGAHGDGNPEPVEA